MIETLKYYSEDGTLMEFTKYMIDIWGFVRNKKGNVMAYTKLKKYNTCGVYDDSGKQIKILIGRAMASTFLGPPPSLVHTADHENKNRDDDMLENIRWLDKTGQSKNRDFPETLKTAFTIAKDGEEKTVKEWTEYLKGEKNSFGRDYNKDMIIYYAQKKQHGFSYKEYPNLPDEVWKKITKSENDKGGRWEISNMSRVKYVTKYAENVLSIDSLGLDKGYPIISINGKQWYCHVLSFMTFFPDEYANKKSDEMILHEDDDKMDFRPYKLRLGTSSENVIDSHINGCRDGTKTARRPCCSYINDVFERRHESLDAAEKYLRDHGHFKAVRSAIHEALKTRVDNKVSVRYGRTWKCVD